MDIILLLGRIFFGGFFFLSGLSHFKNLSNSTDYARSRGVPTPKLAVIGTGLLLLLGGLGIIFGVYVKISLILIIIFFIGVTPKMHPFWRETDPAKKAIEKRDFMKNMALLGATIILYTITTSPWAYSLMF
ncbi:MAG: DoxX family membrane protein [Candidatus Paceibacterota bacterium]